MQHFKIKKLIGHKENYEILGEFAESLIRKGFTARDVQHECDHLDEIVFLERVKEHNGFATKKMINKFNLKEESR